ncbi:hypothetical protein Aperf_G00000037767 [Anoplocephala perfoliata]
MIEDGTNRDGPTPADESTESNETVSTIQEGLPLFRMFHSFFEALGTQNLLMRFSSNSNSSIIPPADTTQPPILTSGPALLPFVSPSSSSQPSFPMALPTFQFLHPVSFSHSNDNVREQDPNCLFSNTAVNTPTNSITTAATMSSVAVLVPPGTSQSTSSTPTIGSVSAHNSKSLSPDTMDDQPLDLSRRASASTTSEASVTNDVTPSALTILTTLIAQALKKNSAGLLNSFKKDAVPPTSSVIGYSRDVGYQRNINLSNIFSMEPGSRASKKPNKWSEGERGPPPKRRRVYDKPHSQVSCDSCDAKLGSRTELNSHMVESHGGWKCLLCPKHFRQYGNLDRHMQSHLSMKAYMCNLCGVSYTRRDHLTRHGREKHQGISPDVYIHRLFSTSKYTELLKTMPSEEVSQRLSMDTERISADEITETSKTTPDCLRSDDNLS